MLNFFPFLVDLEARLVNLYLTKEIINLHRNADYSTKFLVFLQKFYLRIFKNLHLNLFLREIPCEVWSVQHKNQNISISKIKYIRHQSYSLKTEWFPEMAEKLISLFFYNTKQLVSWFISAFMVGWSFQQVSTIQRGSVNLINFIELKYF